MPTITEPVVHTLGGCVINTEALVGVSNIDVSLGQAYETTSTDGSLYPQFGIYNGGKPTITVSHVQPIPVITELTSIGSAIGSSTTFKLLAFDATTQLPTAIGEITMTVALGRVVPSGIETQVGSPSELSFGVICLSDAPAVHPIAYATS